MKVISLVGGRPQFIKEAVLHQELKKTGIEEILVNSGQHYDYNMSDIFLETLNIGKPEYNLGVGPGIHGEMTGKIIIEFEKIVLQIKPNLIIVFGDTNTTLAGALVGAKIKIPVAHVEAGLRMLPKDMPEETNRVVADRVSSLLFCPSQLAVENLKKEGITKGAYLTGDITYDLFLKCKKHFKYEVFNDLKLKEGNFVVVTIHRDYNVDFKDKLSKILKELEKISRKYRVIIPIHPRTRKNIEKFNLTILTKNLTVIEPIDYFNLMGLVSKCSRVITDSGGLQKEAYYAKKPGFLVMPDPAWHELVKHKLNILCDENNLSYQVLKNHPYKYRANLYGDGKAGERIAMILEKVLSSNNKSK
jgi:UDP-GlcNAc3NAcA epimerase